MLLIIYFATDEESKEASDTEDKDRTGSEPQKEDARLEESTGREQTQDEKSVEDENTENTQNGEDKEENVQQKTIISPISGEQMPISSISGGTRKRTESEGHAKKPEKLELQNTPIPAPVNISILGDSSNLTERLERALGSVAPLLREIFVDFAAYLSKTLIGSHGQELLIGGKWKILI